VVRVLAGENALSGDACRAHASEFAWARFGEKLRALCAG